MRAGEVQRGRRARLSGGDRTTRWVWRKEKPAAETAAGLILVEPPASESRVRAAFHNRIFTCLSGGLIFDSASPAGGLRIA